MTEKQASEGAVRLESIEEIRAQFELRQRAYGKGFHALGEEVMNTFFQAQEQLPRPASAMTFRNFLQGKTTLRDPTALELYFQALGATDSEMKSIRATLQHELDRRLASPRHQLALSPFDALDLSSMPYSRALVECEVVTKLESSFAAPATHLTPREYLLGPELKREPDLDPERWGLIQHLDELSAYMARLDQRLAEGLEAVPRADHKARRRHACADLREIATAYASWMLYRPRAGDLLFSRRRYTLHGAIPEDHRDIAVALAKRVARTVYAAIERLTIEVVLQGKQVEARLGLGRAECALERTGERMLSIISAFYIAVVQGSQGTAALFHALYQLRRANAHGSSDWTPHHQALLESYERTLAEARRILEEDQRVPYGVLKTLYDGHLAAARPLMFAIWETSYAPSIARDTLSLLLSELHSSEVLSDKEFLALSKELLTGSENRALLEAAHPRHLFEPLDTAEPGRGT